MATALQARARPQHAGWGRDAALALLALALALLAYLRTMRPTFGWGDSSELTTAAYFLGIGHSPGYPTWMLIAYPFSHLPIGEVAFRVNFMNVLLGAVAISLLYLLCCAISGSRGAALVAALAFAFSATFWDVTTEADVFTLHICFLVLMLLVAMKWRREQKVAGIGMPALQDGDRGQEASSCPTDKARQDRWLYLLSWLVGISMGNHMLTALVVPALIYLVWAERGWRFFLHRRAATCLGFLVLGLSVYALIPIRAMSNPPPHVSNPHSLPDLWNLISAPGARQSMLEHGLGLPLHRAWANLLRLRFEFGLAGCALALVGVGLLWRKDRKVLVTLALIAGLDVAQASNFSVFDVYMYYLPLHLVWALLIAAGTAGALEMGAAAVALAGGRGRSRRPSWGYGLALALLLAAPFTLLTGHLQFVDGSGERDPELFAQAVWSQVAPRALILADWWNAGPLWYSKHVAGARPDVTVSPGPSMDTLAKFERSVARGRLTRYPAVYFVETLTARGKLLRERGFYLVPEGPVSRLLAKRPDPESLLANFPAAPQASFGDQVGLVRAEVAQAALRPGECLNLTLYWTPLPGYRQRPIEAVLVLQNNESGRIWQETNLLGHDLYPLDQWRLGQVLRERHRLYLADPAPPGEYDLLVRLRGRGTSACLACDHSLSGPGGRDYRLARIAVEAPQPGPRDRVPAVLAWLRP